MVFSQFINYDSRHWTINLLNAIRLNLFWGFSQKIRVVPQHNTILLNNTVTPHEHGLRARAVNKGHAMLHTFYFRGFVSSRSVVNSPTHTIPTHFSTFNRIVTRQYTKKIAGCYVDERTRGDKNLPGKVFRRSSISLTDSNSISFRFSRLPFASGCRVTVIDFLRSLNGRYM